MKITYALILTFFSFFVANGQNTWDSIADFGAGQRQRAVSFGLNGKGYVATGLDTADIVRNDLWEYNPNTGLWSQLANLPGVGRRNAVAFTINNKAYVGTGVDHVEAPSGTILNDFYEYDPALNTWLQIDDYPGGSGNGMYFATGFTAGGKGYVCGGKQGPDNYTDHLYEYKPSAGAWAKRASFPGGVRYQMGSFSVNGFAYIGLGADEDIYRRDWWKYNPGSNQWTQLSDFAGNERAGMVTFNLNGRGYIAMGTDGGYRDDVWEYNEEFDTWVTKEKFPGKGRKFACAFTIGDTAYVGIGKSSEGGKRSFNRYYPSSYQSINKKITTNIEVYPNPIATFFSIKTDQNQYNKIEIISLTGTLMKSFYANVQPHKIDNIPSGIYFLLLKDKAGITLSTKKIVIE